MQNAQAILDDLICTKLELLTVYEDHMKELAVYGAPEEVKDMMREEFARVLMKVNLAIEKQKLFMGLE